MTILSTALGYATTIISRVYTFYASVIMFLCFGVKMLKEGYEMSPTHGQVREEEEGTKSFSFPSSSSPRLLIMITVGGTRRSHKWAKQEDRYRARCDGEWISKKRKKKIFAVLTFSSFLISGQGRSAACSSAQVESKGCRQCDSQRSVLAHLPPGLHTHFCCRMGR